MPVFRKFSQISNDTVLLPKNVFFRTKMAFFDFENKSGVFRFFPMNHWHTCLLWLIYLAPNFYVCRPGSLCVHYWASLTLDASDDIGSDIQRVLRNAAINNQLEPLEVDPLSIKMQGM